MVTIAGIVVLALVASAIGVAVYWLIARNLPQWVWIAKIIGLAIALVLFAAGQITIGR